MTHRCRLDACCCSYRANCVRTILPTDRYTPHPDRSQRSIRPATISGRASDVKVTGGSGFCRVGGRPLGWLEAPKIHESASFCRAILGGYDPRGRRKRSSGPVSVDPRWGCQRLATVARRCRSRARVAVARKPRLSSFLLAPLYRRASLVVSRGADDPAVSLRS